MILSEYITVDEVGTVGEGPRKDRMYALPNVELKTWVRIYQKC